MSDRLHRVFGLSSRLFFESLLIVLSVALGFVVAQWHESSTERELATQVLRNVVTEVEGNLASVEEQIARHQKIIAAFGELDLSDESQSAVDVIVGQIGGDFLPGPLGQAAWEAAVSSGALRLMGYDVAAALRRST